MLEKYRRKRHFGKTPEPQGLDASGSGRSYVIQKHAARRLHYDLRLEINGVLKSWAVPKGPSLDPADKRLAVEVEDHPVAYGGFEGVIPKGEYGAGAVLIWDQGEWEPEDNDPEEQLRKGNLKFRLYGRKLKGSWALVRMKAKADDDRRPSEWLLVKHRDQYAAEQGDVAEEQALSTVSGRTIEEVARYRDRIWQAGTAHTTMQQSDDDPIFDPADLPGARKADLPHDLRPQLPTVVDAPPHGEDWLHEIKYDGYRLICLLQEGHVKLITRQGHDWTERFPALVAEAAALPLSRAVIDGEVAVLRKDGTTDFQALQNYLKGRLEGRLVYFLFDLPYLQGFDLSAVPLVKRKQILEAILKKSRTSVLQYSSQIIGQGGVIYRRSCDVGTEGIVSKKLDAPYKQGRSDAWVKVKCRRRQEFVIGGYAVTEKAPAGLKSLLVGYHDAAGDLVYAGKVGTGFSDQQRQDLRQMLDGRRRSSTPFTNAPRERGLSWVEPELVAEIAFAQWTREGVLRQPAFKGLREDKPAGQVIRENVDPAMGVATGLREIPRTQPAPPAKRSSIIGVRLTNPDRVLFPGSRVTKTDLLHYYQTVADLILPHIIRRPLTMVRCPEGIGSECFYQKHVTQSLPPAFATVRIRENASERDYLYITEGSGLDALAQISALEIHPWGSRIDDPDKPDTIIFDLDPAPDLEWEQVIHAAWHLRGILQGLGLVSFVKTSGGKGLHVQLPFRRGPDWTSVKTFAGRIARGMAADQPGRYTASPRKDKRTGKIFVDYLRNARGATSVAPYAVRARSGAPLSMPVHWQDLSSRMGPDAFALPQLAAHLRDRGEDPWKDYFKVDNRLPKAP